MVYVKAQVGPAKKGDAASMFTVQYFDHKVSKFIRSGGSRAWRCNNPGNLQASSYSTSTQRRSIGTAGDIANTYAVYPDYETGHAALIVMLKGSVYSPLTLRTAMERYDKRNPKYIDIIVEKTGLKPERTIKSLTDQEFKKFWQAIEVTEKWAEGEEKSDIDGTVSAVRKKRGVIYEYLVSQGGKEVWLSKQDAIALAKAGKLRAIVVHASNGSVYLRPEFHEKPFHEMVC